MLHNDVLPFYRNLDLPVTAVLTDNGREFCGTENHPYELYLDLNGIEHRRTKVRTPRTNGFVERFNGTVLDEFFRVKLRETCLRQRRVPPGRPRRLARPLQHRTPAPRLPQHGPPAPRHRHVIRQPRRLRGHLRIHEAKPHARVVEECGLVIISRSRCQLFAFRETHMVYSLKSLGTLVTIDEVADFFRVHRKTIDKWHKTKPDFLRKLELADGSKRFMLAEIEDYLAALLKDREQHGNAA